MGWSGMQIPAGTSKIDALRMIEGDSFVNAIVASNTVGNTLYAACRTTQDPDVIIGAVILFERSNGETCVKVMDETMGPYFYGASAKVLDTLTPTTDADAVNWRKVCRETVENKPRPGDLVRTDADLVFSKFTLPIGTMVRVIKANKRTVDVTILDNNKAVRVPLNAVRLVGA